MTGVYQIYGAEMSPYSVKVRAYLRYKGVPYEWRPRSQHVEEFKRRARLPIIPLVITPDDEALQDSTPIIERLEERFPDPSIHPEEPRLAFLSALIEEYGDEWGNKLMFHHRWHAEPDPSATAHVLARGIAPYGDAETIARTARQLRERMTGRRHFVGSSELTAPLISGYLDDLIAVLEPHLARRRYLLGDRPAFADFGLAPQLYEAALDPTAGGIIRARAENVLGWCYRMCDPRDDGPFEPWEELEPTLRPLLEDAGRHFLPWSHANREALAAEAETFTVELAGKDYTQPPQKYHAKSLEALRRRYAAVGGDAGLDAVLESTGCLRYLA